MIINWARDVDLTVYYVGVTADTCVVTLGGSIYRVAAWHASYILVYTRIYSYISVYTRVKPYILVYTRIYLFCQGVLLSVPETMEEVSCMKMLWVHEVARVFGDRLVSHSIKSQLPLVSYKCKGSQFVSNKFDSV